MVNLYIPGVTLLEDRRANDFFKICDLMKNIKKTLQSYPERSSSDLTLLGDQIPKILGNLEAHRISEKALWSPFLGDIIMAPLLARVVEKGTERICTDFPDEDGIARFSFSCRKSRRHPLDTSMVRISCPTVIRDCKCFEIENCKALICSVQDSPHLIDFLLLAFHDRLTKGLDFRISDIGFAAHQNRTGMMWDHGLKKLFVGDGRLLTYAQKENYSN